MVSDMVHTNQKMRGYWFLTDEEVLVHIRASMIMLNTYYDIMGSAEILEIASKAAGNKPGMLGLETTER